MYVNTIKIMTVLTEFSPLKVQGFLKVLETLEDNLLLRS